MTTTATAGLDDGLTLDGAALQNPNTFDMHNVLAQSLTQAIGRPRLDVWRHADGLPNVPDRFEWALEYDIDDNNSATNVFLEKIRTEGGVHLFADWKARRYTYTARAGQQFFYLPRQDAFSLGYAGHTTALDYGAKFFRNGVALTVIYKPTVASSDVVPSGQVWVSDATTVIPRAGMTGAAFKIGTPNVLGDVLLVEYNALYRVVVLSVPTVPFSNFIGREDKAIYLAEVA